MARKEIDRASDPSTKPETLAKMAQFRGKAVSAAARANPSLPPTIHEEFLDQGDRDAWRNPATLLLVFSGALHAQGALSFLVEVIQQQGHLSTIYRDALSLAMSSAGSYWDTPLSDLRDKLQLFEALSPHDQPIFHAPSRRAVFKLALSWFEDEFCPDQRMRELVENLLGPLRPMIARGDQPDGLAINEVNRAQSTLYDYKSDPGVTASACYHYKSAAMLLNGMVANKISMRQIDTLIEQLAKSKAGLLHPEVPISNGWLAVRKSYDERLVKDLIQKVSWDVVASWIESMIQWSSLPTT